MDDPGGEPGTVVTRRRLGLNQAHAPVRLCRWRGVWGRSRRAVDAVLFYGGGNESLPVRAPIAAPRALEPADHSPTATLVTRSVAARITEVNPAITSLGGGRDGHLFQNARRESEPMSGLWFDHQD